MSDVSFLTGFIFSAEEWLDYGCSNQFIAQ